MLNTASDPVSLPPKEARQVRELDRILNKTTSAVVATSRERIKLPSTVYKVLRRAVRLMAAGQAVSLIPDNAAITTQRAADILGMSRPFFVKLLETGALPHHRAGNQRRVYLKDVLHHLRRRDEEREASLDRLSRQAYRSGLYDRNEMSEGA